MDTWISVETEPPKGKCFVCLEEEADGLLIHAASYHKNLKIIGGHFDFDMPKVLFWIPQDALPPPPTDIGK